MKRSIFLLIVAIVAVVQSIVAQNAALKTNLLADGFLSPNLGVEIGLVPKWTLNLSGQFNEMPVIQDLLFVHTTRNDLDLIVRKIPTLQYRYIRGNIFQNPVTARETDMERFIYAVNASDDLQYYLYMGINFRYVWACYSYRGRSLERLRGQTANRARF